MLTTFPYSYLYQAFNDDENLQALVDAQNATQQEYIDAFNALSLPVYTGPLIVGPLLDFVLTGLYNVPRGYLATVSSVRIGGAYNTWAYNRIPYNARKNLAPAGFLPVNDDVYKRIATWTLYRGDGRQFTISWLKRRVMRFLLGANGTDPGIQETYDVSVTFPSDHECTITLSATLANAALFKQVVDAGLLPLPFQYSFTVDLT